MTSMKHATPMLSLSGSEIAYSWWASARNFPQSSSLCTRREPPLARWVARASQRRRWACGIRPAGHRKWAGGRFALASEARGPRALFAF
jgi:hypothetical protein